jgi:hypothetical protein
MHKVAANCLTLCNTLSSLADTLLRSTGSLDPATSKPFCAAMVQLGLDNQGIPERLHPKSFHSAFGHNTNVWASRESKVRRSACGCSIFGCVLTRLWCVYHVS